MSAAVLFDARACELGEGPLWHPERAQLFWFDILGKKLLSRVGDTPLEWQFEEHVSAAGWLDHDTLLIASETGLYRFGLETGARELIHAIEADIPETRSNDGRADPKGGFWIGTMRKDQSAPEGAIYRFYKGELRRLFSEVTVSNSICFTPDGGSAYFTDTPTHRIMRQPLDEEGWPVGAPEVFVDLSDEGYYPDGSVVDAEGALWSAQWGAARVARYMPDGSFDRAITVPARQASCPAFGGVGLDRLYVTSAFMKMKAPDAAQGQTYVADPGCVGLPEARVIL